MEINTGVILMKRTTLLSIVLFLTFGSKLGLATISDNEWMVFSTYIGGSGADGAGDMVFDSDGNIVVTTFVDSANFPVKNAYQPVSAGGVDLVIFKFSSDGQKLIFSTYLGGSNDDYSYTLALDSSDNIFITGSTSSADFPISQNAFQPNKSSSTYDIFLVKISADGQSLLYSSFLGGSSDKFIATNIILDSSENLIISGSTSSPDFPTKQAYQEVKGTFSDGFLTKLSADGQTLLYSTYFGGNGNEQIRGLTLDSSNNIVFCGFTSSTDFPTLNEIQSKKSSDEYDTFIAKLSNDGKSLVFSTLFGGCREYALNNLILDQDDNILVVGETSSSEFPTVNAHQPDYGGGSSDAFLSKLTEDGKTLVFSTYIGGSGDDNSFSIVLDTNDDIILSGSTSSSDFPLVRSYQESDRGWDGFITKFSLDGLKMVFSTYLAGSGSDFCVDIAYNNMDDSLIISGHTSSWDFPIKNAYQSSYAGGGFDSFICEILIESEREGSVPSFQIIAVILSVLIIVVRRKQN